MELKHDGVKKVQKNEQPKTPKVRAFATALGLTTGLALLSTGTAKAQSVEDPRFPSRPYQSLEVLTAPESKPTTDLECIPGIAVVCRANKTVVKAGDPILTAEILFENAGIVSLNVKKVDAKGIEIVSKAEVFMSEHTTSKPFRVNFGETKTKTIGEFVLKQVAGAIKVEKGAEPGTAVVTVLTTEEAHAETMDKIRTKLKCPAFPAVNTVCAANNAVLKVGDPVLAVEFVFEQAGYFTWNVSKIDSKGIEIGEQKEIFMGVHESFKPFRVNFGETKLSESPLMAVGSLKVEKGPEPGTAIVTIVPSEGYTEVKKTTKAKMPAAAGVLAPTTKEIEPLGDKLPYHYGDAQSQRTFKSLEVITPSLDKSTEAKPK